MKKIPLLTLCFALILLLGHSFETAGQDAPVCVRWVGPGWLVGGGVLRCDVNAQWQLVLEAKTAKLQNASLKDYPPQISSSNAAVAFGVVEQNPASHQILCSSDGRAEVTLKVGNLTLCIPVLVGKAKTQDSAPCSNGYGMTASATGDAPRASEPDKPVRGRFVGPDWLIGKGALVCKPDAQTQLVLEATTSKLQRADLKFYPPRVRSSNESVAGAVLDADPNSLQIRCSAPGRSEVTVQMADLSICIPVIVAVDPAKAVVTPCGGGSSLGSTPRVPSPTTSQTPRQQPTETARLVPGPQPRSTPRNTGSTVPNAPTNFGAKYLSGGNIALAWEKVEGADSYDILYTSGGAPAGLNLQPITENYHVSRALTPGTYTLVARATSGGGTSPDSQPVTVTVPRWSGKYRVTINGFKVNRETLDNPLEGDGKRNEVYVQATAQVVSSQGIELSSTTARTFTHGDVNSARWQDSSKPNYRIPAGSASAKGGLMTGDAHPDRLMPWKRKSESVYSQQFPLLAWEGEILEDVNSVVIVPTIYEDDEKPNPLIESAYKDLLTILSTPPRNNVDVEIPGTSHKIPLTRVLYVNRRTVHRSITDAVDTVDRAMKALQRTYSLTPEQTKSSALLLSKLNSALQLVENNLATLLRVQNLADRPIGLTSVRGKTNFEPAVIFLDFTDAEAVIAGTATGSLMPGIIAIDYKDQVALGGNGDYTLFIEVQRIP